MQTSTKLTEFWSQDGPLEVYPIGTKRLGLYTILSVSHWMRVGPRRNRTLSVTGFFNQGDPQKGLTTEGHFPAALPAAVKMNL